MQGLQNDLDQGRIPTKSYSLKFVAIKSLSGMHNEINAIEYLVLLPRRRPLIRSAFNAPATDFLFMSCAYKMPLYFSVVFFLRPAPRVSSVQEV